MPRAFATYLLCPAPGDREHSERAQEGANIERLTQEIAELTSPSDQAALDDLVERTYGKVKQIAARMPGVAPGTSVSPTVLANETYLKFLRSRNSLIAK